MRKLSTDSVAGPDETSVAMRRRLVAKSSAPPPSTNRKANCCGATGSAPQRVLIKCHSEHNLIGDPNDPIIARTRR